MKIKIQVELEVEVDVRSSIENLTQSIEKSVIKYGPDFSFGDLLESKVDFKCTKLTVLGN